MNCRMILLLLMVLLGARPLQGMVNIRVSVKLILDSAGNLPMGNSGTNSTQNFRWDPYNYDTTERVRTIIDRYNGMLDRMGRGYRLQLTETVLLSGLSRWFNTPARDAFNRAQLEVEAKANPVAYAYRPNAHNVYINNSSSGVSGGHLPLLGDVIFMGATGYSTMLLHELAHGTGLCHTFGCFCNGCESGDCGNNPSPDSPGDLIADTILDSACWSTRDEISRGNFGLLYISISAARRRQVDDIFFNIMSYHNNVLDRFTRGQWERMVDVMNLEKRNVTSGKTVFVDRANGCLRPEDLAEPFKTLATYTPGWSWGLRTGLGVTLDPRSPPLGVPPLACPPNLPCSLAVCLGGPFKNLKDAVNDAVSGDRLQIVSGHYGGRIRITKRLTLTAERGTVRLGTP